jgi:hypothetical protein
MQPTDNQLVQKLGKPIEVVIKGDGMEYKGWSIPIFTPRGTSKTYIYESPFGWRYYVFIDGETGRALGYFMGSS